MSVEKMTLQPMEKIAEAGRPSTVHRDARAVVCLRICTFLLIGVSMSVAVTMTYINVRKGELELMGMQYEDSAKLLGEGLKRRFSSKVLSAAALANYYTGRFGRQNKNNAMVWPNVTISNFEEQTMDLLTAAVGRAISFNPIVTNETRRSFEEYAASMAGNFGADSLLVAENVGDRVVSDGIFCSCAVDGGIISQQDDPGLHAHTKYPTWMVPVYQIAPIKSNSKAVLYNLHVESARVRALDDMITYKVPTLTAVLQLVQDRDDRPSSILFHPVFGEFKENGEKADVTGSISIIFSWDDVLANNLPYFMKGIIVVLRARTSSSETRFLFSFSRM